MQRPPLMCGIILYAVSAESVNRSTLDNFWKHQGYYLRSSFKDSRNRKPKWKSRSQPAIERLAVP